MNWIGRRGRYLMSAMIRQILTRIGTIQGQIPCLEGHLSLKGAEVDFEWVFIYRFCEQTKIFIWSWLGLWCGLKTYRQDWSLWVRWGRTKRMAAWMMTIKVAIWGLWWLHGGDYLGTTEWWLNGDNSDDYIGGWGEYMGVTLVTTWLLWWLNLGNLDNYIGMLVGDYIGLTMVTTWWLLIGDYTEMTGDYMGVTLVTTQGWLRWLHGGDFGDYIGVTTWGWLW